MIPLHLPLWTEARGRIVEVSYTDDDIRIVLSSGRQLTVHVPRHQIISELIPLAPDQFISILRTDAGYNILTHLHDQEHRASGDSSKPVTMNDVKQENGK